MLTIVPVGGNGTNLPVVAGEFSKTGWKPGRDLSYEEWEQTGLGLQYVQGAINWWVGDWLNYGERRYGETYAQAVEATGWEEQRLRNCKWVAANVELSLRKDNLEWSHHAEVAALEPEEQADMLAWAAESGATVADLKAEKKRRARQHLLENPDLPARQYRVIYADPPWSYDNSGFDQSAESQYPTMTVDDICALPVGELAAEPAVLYLWATSPLLPEALRVMAAWGFEYKAHRIWKKDRAPGMGWWASTYHELLLIGTANGNYHPAEKLPSVVEEPVTKHSRKPERFRHDIELVHEAGPYLELFAREAAEGWDAWGNEL